MIPWAELAPETEYVEMTETAFVAWCNRQTAMAVDLDTAIALFEGDLFYAPSDHGHTDWVLTPEP